jgi:two-component system NtrC family response regulator
MKRQIKLLFVDDEERFLKGMTERLKLRDLMVHSFNNGPDALAAAKKETYDVALLDLKMPEMDGEDVLKNLKQMNPALEVIILTGHGSEDSAVRTFREGAYEYLMKPCELDELMSAVTRAYAKRLKAKNQDLKEKANAIIASSDDYTPRELLRMLQDLEEEDG